MASPPCTRLRSRLPVEVVDRILQELPPRYLQPLLTVNTAFSAIALRCLYHTIVLPSPKTSILLFHTLLANPLLPPLVHALDTNFAPASPTSNLYRLLHAVLLRLSSLTSLTLELPRHHSPLWIFTGCTFKLTQFTTSHHCRRPLARFLDSQPGITDLTLRGFQNDSHSMLSFLDPPLSHTSDSSLAGDEQFSLLPGSLPNLTTFNAVHAGASVVRAVMLNRPVRVVSIPLFPNCVEESFSALQAAEGDLRRLSVISFDPEAPEFLFEEVAKRFRKLEALHLVVLMADFTNEHLAASGRYLKCFDSLKYITCVASSKDDTNSRSEECSLATEWHKLCPSLQTIILPKGRVWFHGRIGQCNWSCLEDDEEEED